MAARDGVIFAFVFPRPMLRYVSALSQPDFYILVLYLDHSIERRRFFSRRVNRVSDKSRSPWAHLTSVWNRRVYSIAVECREWTASGQGPSRSVTRENSFRDDRPRVLASHASLTHVSRATKRCTLLPQTGPSREAVQISQFAKHWVDSFLTSLSLYCARITDSINKATVDSRLCPRCRILTNPTKH